MSVPPLGTESVIFEVICVPKRCFMKAIPLTSDSLGTRGVYGKFSIGVPLLWLFTPPLLIYTHTIIGTAHLCWWKIIWLY